MIRPNMFALLMLVVLAITSVNADCPKVKRDVCVIGGGAAGMSIATLLKDRGYDPVVLERESVVGGHCNTQYFDPPEGETVDWIDYGVQLFMNTTQLNLTGVGSWSLATDKFAERFIGPNATLPLEGNDINLYVNMETGELVIPNVNETALNNALGVYFYLLSMYPWTSDGKYTGTIPPELLQSFGDFARPFGLNAMAEIFRAFGYNSGIAYGNYTNLPALYMLNAASMSVMQVLLGPSTTTFKVKGGCYSVYRGMSDYLGSENIVLNATVTELTRSFFLSTKSPRLRGYTTRADGSTDNFEYECEKVVVAHPPTLDDLSYVDLTQNEQDLFSNVEVAYYYAGVADISSSYLNGNSFQVMNADPSSEYNVPFGPGLISLGRYVDYGPTQIQAISNTNLEVCDMLEIITRDFENIPSWILNSFDIKTFDQHREYAPHFNLASLSNPVSPYAKLAELQGSNNTYWVSALNRYTAATAHVWDEANIIVNTYFPSKN